MTRRKEDADFGGQDQLLDVHHVARMLNISETSVARYDGRDGFPASLRLVPTRARRWRLADVQEYVKGLRS